MYGLLEKHISLTNALEKYKGTLFSGQVSNLLSGLGCALNGLIPRETEGAEDGVQMFLAEVQHLGNIKPARLMPFLAAGVEL